MLISHRKRFIYTKTLKSASTSVEVYFEPYCFPPGQYHFMHFRPQYESESGIVGFRGRNRDNVGNRWYHHAPAAEIKAKIGDRIWGDYFKFCVVRNPFDKLVSAFHFYVLSKARCADLPFEQIRAQFRRWMLRRMFPFPDDWSIFTIDDRVCVDYVIRFEQLLTGVEEVCRRLAIPFEPDRLPRLKAETNPRLRHFSEYYDSETTQIAAEKYERDIRQFGYRLSA